jgi:hypothetical protein
MCKPRKMAAWLAASNCSAALSKVAPRSSFKGTL